jgi:hypothetical protein
LNKKTCEAQGDEWDVVQRVASPGTFHNVRKDFDESIAMMKLVIRLEMSDF